MDRFFCFQIATLAQRDRRNVSIVAVVLMLVGFIAPMSALMDIRRAVATPDGISMARGIDILATILIGCSAWFGLGEMHLHRYRQAVRMFLWTWWFYFVLTSALHGVPASDSYMPYLILGFAAHVVGRYALWSSLVMLLANRFCVEAIDVFVRHQLATVDYPQMLWSTSLYAVAACMLDRMQRALYRSDTHADLKVRRSRARQAQWKRLRTRAACAARGDAAARVAAGVAHDIRNLLAIIGGYAARRDRLADNGRAELVGAMKQIELAALRASAITGRLLSTCANDETFASRFDVCAALAALRPMLTQLFAPHVRLELRLPDAPLFVHLDQVDFELMVLNLALNARDAMPHGGIFEVHAQRINTSDSLLLSLSDSGSGIDRRHLPHIFESFITTKQGGYGLGLFVVKELVERWRGSMAAHSIVGQGTTLQLRLPCSSLSTIARGDIASQHVALTANGQ